MFAYYASIMLNALACPLSLKLCWHNQRRPTRRVWMFTSRPLMIVTTIAIELIWLIIWGLYHATSHH